MIQRHGVEIYQWEQEGYQPLVFFDGWQVALLNWEPVFDLKNLSEIERHRQTDEVFMLVKGKAVLFTINAEGKMNVDDMLPNVIYNVTQDSSEMRSNVKNRILREMKDVKRIAESIS